MKKRIGLTITIIISALVFSLLIWRFWPQSFSNITFIDNNSITVFSGVAMVSQLGSGEPITNTYLIDGTEQQNNTVDDMIEILNTSKYQQDFRNLLPLYDSISAGRNYDGQTVSLVFSVENPNDDDYVHIQFLSSSIIVVSGNGKSAHRVYHPTNHRTIDLLVEYLQMHGFEQQ